MEEDTAGSDVRAYKRRHLIYYLEVYDDETGDLLGHLVDITLQGLKLTSKKEIMTGEKIQEFILVERFKSIF